MKNMQAYVLIGIHPAICGININVQGFFLQTVLNEIFQTLFDIDLYFKSSLPVHTTHKRPWPNFKVTAAADKTGERNN